MPTKNSIICFTEGSYSDYSLMGHFRCLNDFSMKEEGRKYLAKEEGMVDVLEYFDRSSKPWRRLEKPIKVGERPGVKSADGFQAFLIRKGLVEPFDVQEYWAGDYNFKGFDED